MITFEDITRQLLDQRQAAWSDVARRIAHEIKNPLTPIQLATERLKRRYRKQIVERRRAVRGTDRHDHPPGRRPAARWSTSSPRFARLPKPVFRHEDAVDLVRQALFLQEVAHPEIDYRFAADGGRSPPIACDRHQFGQAMTNVLKNAAEAIEATRARTPSPTIAAASRSRSTADDAHLTVERDRQRHRPAAGPRAHRRALRDDAREGHRARPRDRQEDRRGARRRHELSPARDGGGTRVTLRFARDPVGRRTQAARRPNDHSRTGGPMMALDILVVDDEHDIRELVAGVLSDEGYECRTAGDSTTRARAWSTSAGPSLVLLDVWLHGSPMDGLEVLDAIKAREPELPVIIFSGHGNIDTAVSAISRGAMDFIEKPFEAERLLLLVARATETERLRRENARLREGFAHGRGVHRQFQRDQPGPRHAQARRQHRQPGADHRPGRVGQGSRRAAAPRLEPARRQGLRHRQFGAHHARAVRAGAVRRGSRRQAGARRACSRWPTAARSISTRSPTCRSAPRRASCAC